MFLLLEGARACVWHSAAFWRASDWHWAEFANMWPSKSFRYHGTMNSRTEFSSGFFANVELNLYMYSLCLRLRLWSMVLL